MLLKHKHFRLDQDKLDKAKTALGVATDTEAVDRALDFVLEEEVLRGVLQQVRGRARIQAVFEPDGEGAR